MKGRRLILNDGTVIEENLADIEGHLRFLIGTADVLDFIYRRTVGDAHVGHSFLL